MAAFRYFQAIMNVPALVSLAAVTSNKNLRFKFQSLDSPDTGGFDAETDRNRLPVGSASNSIRNQEGLNSLRGASTSSLHMNCKSSYGVMISLRDEPRLNC